MVVPDNPASAIYDLEQDWSTKYDITPTKAGASGIVFEDFLALAMLG